MFANYGLTALAAQALEKSLLLLIAAIECLETGQTERDALYDVFGRHNRKPLGRLIAVLREKVTLPQDLESDLGQALGERNHVMHNFFLNGFEVSDLERSVEKMSEELRPIRDHLNAVSSRIDAMVGVVQERFEVTREKLDRQARQLLENYQASVEKKQ